MNTTRLLLTVFGALTCALSTFASDEQVLFQFGNHTVSSEEFIRVYEKNNINNKNNYSDTAVREYLDLYVKFKLKVQEAKDMNLFEKESIQKEFESYRKQLSQSYLVDKQITGKLLKEAYERSKYDVRASHILISVKEGATEEEEQAAKSKAKALIQKAMAGGDFATLAKENSEDPSAAKNGGDLGYFSVLQMVYPFETGVYKTPVGEIAPEPVRTRFGYHVIKVTDKKPGQGKIKVAHIFIRNQYKNPQGENAEKVINNIHDEILKGEDFSMLARKYSQDKTSKRNGGVLPWFGSGKMVETFENKAFELANDGDISEPFQSEYGWHIVKRLDRKEIGTFEEMKAELKRKIDRDTRANTNKKDYIERLKKEYSYKIYDKNKAKLYQKVDDRLLEGKWDIEKLHKWKKPLFVLDSKKTLQKEFITYLLVNQPKRPRKDITTEKLFDNLYDEFEEKQVMEYEETQLERKYPEFKALIEEYRDGILLFDLIDTRVWSKAVKDTNGLKEFYAKNKADYQWKERVEATIYTTNSEEDAKQVKDMLKKGRSKDEIEREVNGEASSTKKLIISEGKYEEGQNDMVDNTSWKMGISDIMQNDKKWVVVHIGEKLQPAPKSLEEARGYVISDYQDELEQEWIESLKKRYPVQVNEEVLETIIKE